MSNKYNIVSQLANCVGATVDTDFCQNTNENGRIYYQTG